MIHVCRRPGTGGSAVSALILVHDCFLFQLARRGTISSFDTFPKPVHGKTHSLTQEICFFLRDIMQYRADIDGLRAVAVLPVLFFHAGVPYFSGGFIGVDVFFVISGYVITKGLRAEMEAGHFSVAGFYERRFRRIFPALVATLCLTFAAALFLLLPQELVDLSNSLIASVLSVSNIYFWRSSSYFDASSHFRPLLHTWSLSVEEQFYILMPLAMVASRYFFGRTWRYLFWPVLLVSLLLSIAATYTAPTANFYLLPTRAWEILLGAMLVLTPPTKVAPWLAEILATAGLALIGYCVVAYGDSTPFPGLSALLRASEASSSYWPESTIRHGSSGS